MPEAYDCGDESRFIELFQRDHEVSVQLLPGDSFVERMDKTAEHVQGVIKKYGLERIENLQTVSGMRYTEEYGHHYWVRTWDPRAT